MPEGRVEPGLIQHSLGWPLDSGTYGGSFIYHLDNNRVYVGFVVGLDYRRSAPVTIRERSSSSNTIRSVKPLLEGGEILAAGARTIASGGWQSIPRLEMPGAMLIGDSRQRPEPAQDQGHPPGHPLRHAGRRASGRSRCAGRIRCALARLARRSGIEVGSQLQAGLQARPVVRHGQLGARSHHRRPHAVDAEESACRLRAPATAGRIRLTRSALGRAHPAAARPPGVGVLRLHDS